MSFITNMRISIRLAAGFVAVLILTVAAGTVGINSAKTLATVTNQFHDHPFVVVRELSEARAAFRGIRINMRDVIMAFSAQEVEESIAAIEADSKEFLSSMAIAKAATLGDKALFDESVAAFKAYQETVTEMIAKSKAGDRDGAMALLYGRGAELSKLSAERNEAIVTAAAKQAETFMDSAHATSADVNLMLATLSGLSLIIGALIAFLTGRSISRPIDSMTGVMGELARNNLTVDVPHGGRGDEIGLMARSVAHFKDQLIRVRQLEADQEEQKKQAELDRAAAMRKLADTFEASVGKVIETVTSAATEIQAASGQMSGTATETSAQATTVASSAQQASANVQTVASATEELAASIKEIAHQVERSQAVSVRAGHEAGSTTEQVRALSDNVGKIGEIVKLINDIAAQTNLLALNATIEAARAGDAGKGFAVVAGEVKNLANQTGKATDEIAAQIKAVQEGTSAAVQAIASISQVIGEMGEISSAVAAAVEEQSAATTEIARNVEQAATGTEEVSSNIVSVEQAARETGHAAEQIKDSATDLSKQAEFLRREVGRFLTQVRADKKDMTLLRLDDSLLTGFAEVDDHHRLIFDQINDFYRQMMAGDGGKAAISVLSTISRTMGEHFREEEALMTKAGYPGLNSHRSSHAGFLERIVPLRRAVEENRPNANTALFEYLSSWLQEHISKDDSAMAAHLRHGKAA
ncbi:MAG: bacteriohemerythrin [Magnetospirillum sp.]|nr:bacteriohemerythrin [Magnetospirillum sp.]